MREIFDSMLKRNQYKLAFKTASCYASLRESQSDLTLLEVLIKQPFDDDLLRAEALLAYAEALQAQDKAEEASKHLETSETLFAAVGHVYWSRYIKIKRLRKGEPSEMSRQERIDALLNIKFELEKLEHWVGVRQALQALYDINLEAGNDSFSTTLNIEFLRLRETCRNAMDWISQRMIIVRRWQFTQANLGQSLQPVEELYWEMVDMDAPIFLTDLVMLLHDINKKIGDSEKARYWLSQQRHPIPRSILILYDLEPFFQRLRATTSRPEPEAEWVELKQELGGTKEMISKTVSLEDRAIEIQRVSDIAETYILQYQIRDLEQTKKLVGLCMHFMDDSYSMVSSNRGKDLKAVALQLQARLKFVEAHLLPFSANAASEKIEYLLESSRLQQDAHDLYIQIDKGISISFAKSQIASCLETVWSLQNSPPESEFFHKATNLYVDAVELSRKLHHTTSLRQHAMSLLKLWYRGYQENIIVSQDSASDKISPLQMVQKYLGEVEDLTNIERNDLSALKNERSILAKQNLRKRKDVLELHDIALQVCAGLDDNTPLWDWTQKAKARGVSDLLALGINLPEDLKAEINADKALLQLVKEESQKRRDIETAPADRQFYMSKELEMHRTKMREHPLLSEMLNLREGHPVDLPTLRKLQSLQTPATRKIVFVDWILFANHCGIVIVTEDAIHAELTKFTVEDARNWKQKYLTYNFKQPHPLDYSDVTPLQELSSVIKPLQDLTKKDDLLVFCPTAVLHGIPLHAATIDNTSKVSIIERNPIIYTSSLTTFHHCVSRELQRSGGSTSSQYSSNNHYDGGVPTPSLSHSWVAVYEETDGNNVGDESWKEFRNTVYKNTRELGSQFAESKINVGRDVSPQVLRDAFSQSDMMYFFGHCNDACEDILSHALILATQDQQQQQQELTATMTAMTMTDKEQEKDETEPRHEPTSTSTSTSINTTTENSITTTLTTTTPSSPPPQPPSDHSKPILLRTQIPHHFTVRDIFSSPITSSNITLIACGSASESHTPGDEPLGIVTALLCAGASSVLGTLWTVQTGPGLLFSRRFYKELRSSIEAEEAEMKKGREEGKEKEAGSCKDLLLVDLAVTLQKVVCTMKTRNPDFREPYQWAAYMLSGAWFLKRDRRD